MGFLKIPYSTALSGLLIFLLVVLESHSATLEDIFNLNQPSRPEREAQYYQNRYGSDSTVQKVSSLPIKPEDTADVRERDNANIGKRCVRCDYYNRDNYRYPYDSRSRYDDRYDRYDRYDDKYDDRYTKDRYDDRSRDRDRYYDDYDRRYDVNRRYTEYDRRYDDRDRYDRDRYERRPEYETYDRVYDRDRYDRDDRYRYYDRNRGVSGGYRPWDETTRGSSGFDSTGRGYYFAVGRPEYNTGYANGWNNYDDRNSSRDRWRDQGFSSGSTSNRPRDPYDPGYRGTSYLYGRPSSTTTTQSPSPLGGNAVTDNPDSQSNTSSG